MEMEFFDFDAGYVVDHLGRIGGVSIRVISFEVVEYLASAAQDSNFVKREELVMPSGVYQDVYGVDDLSENSLFHVFMDEWQRFVSLKTKGFGNLFETPISFNDVAVQLYKAGSRGITPHLDDRKYINLICIFPLLGRGRFCICKDRKGENPVELDSSLGNVILMRGPGFRNSKQRPLHFISDIQGPRISLGIRQVAESSR